MAKISVKLLIAVVLVVLGFTLLDYLGHVYLETHNSLEQVPSSYFTNKIIFGSLLLFVGVFIVDWLRKRYPLFERPYYKASALTLFVVLLLQLRYMYYGYSTKFHILVLCLHYLTLMPLIYFAQKRMLSRNYDV